MNNKFVFLVSFLFYCNLFALQKAPYRLRVPYDAITTIVELFEVFNAIDDDDFHEVLRLLRKKPYLTTVQDSRGYTPLHHALSAENRRTFMSVLMVDNHSKAFMIRDKKGFTPLFLSTFCSDHFFLSMLLSEDGIEKSFHMREPKSGRTVLHSVVAMGKIDHFYALMVHESVHLMFGKRDKRKRTPLELAYLIDRMLPKNMSGIFIPTLERAYLDSGTLHAFACLRIVGSRVVPPSHLRLGAGRVARASSPELRRPVTTSAVRRRPKTAFVRRRKCKRKLDCSSARGSFFLTDSAMLPWR